MLLKSPVVNVDLSKAKPAKHYGIKVKDGQKRPVECIVYGYIPVTDANGEPVMETKVRVLQGPDGSETRTPVRQQKMAGGRTVYTFCLSPTSGGGFRMAGPHAGNYREFAPDIAQAIASACGDILDVREVSRPGDEEGWHKAKPLVAGTASLVNRENPVSKFMPNRRTLIERELSKGGAAA